MYSKKLIIRLRKRVRRINNHKRKMRTIYYLEMMFEDVLKEINN